MSLLRDCWYIALPGKELKPGQLVNKKILDETIVLGRRGDGQVFAMRDICPHRGIPLSYGWIEGSDVRCCYHGWMFRSQDGRCCEIPSLTDDDKRDISKIRVPTFPCRELQGHVWIFVPRDIKKPVDESSLPEVPRVEDFGDVEPDMEETMHFACHVDHAVIGLMDPAHGSYVHTSWWWRKGPRKFRVKEKQYEPVPMGFRLVPYELTNSASVYKWFGNKVSTEISFQIPTVRMEIVRGDRNIATSLTTITPIDETACELHQALYTTAKWVSLVKPILRILGHRFLDQDRTVVIQQQEGLAYDPNLMLIDDADRQAQWYFQLKKEFERSQQEERAFVNPVKPSTLRWRS